MKKKYREIEGKLSPIRIYRDILCVPMEALLTPWRDGYFKGGPIYPDWEEKPIVRHFKNNKEPVDDLSEYKEPMLIIDKPVAWGGAIHQHYGHFIADLCIPRIPPILADFPDLPFIFGIITSNLKKPLPWMEEILKDYFGIKDIILIKEPVIIKELYVPPQIERVGTGIFDKRYLDTYLDFLDNLAFQHFGVSKPEDIIYVSRSKLKLAKILGETYLDKLFKQENIKVIYPEELSAIEQLKLYYNAKKIIFSEGSAIHTLHLLGRLKNTEVIIINRRHGKKIAHNQLSYRVNKVKYIDAVMHINNPYPINPLLAAFIKIQDVLKELKEEGIDICKHFKEREFNICVMNNTLEYLFDIKNMSHPFKNELVQEMKQRLTDLNLIHLYYLVFPEEEMQELKIKGELKEIKFNPYLEHDIFYLKTIDECLSYDPALSVKLPQIYYQTRIMIEKLFRRAFANKLYHLASYLSRILETSFAVKHLPLQGLAYRGAGYIEDSDRIFTEILQSKMNNKALDRTTIVQHLINRKNAKVYLEIGVAKGINFLQIKAPIKLAVDPKFAIPGGYENTDNEKFFEITSDEFFANPPDEILKEGLDIVFVDGLHTYEQSLKDVENTLKFLKPDGIIVMHDCLPDSSATAAPTLEEAKKHPEFKGTWTGDVYKTIIHLRATRSDLFVAVVNTDWGVCLIKRGTPESMLDISVEEIKNITFEEFNQSRDNYLNLKQPDWFYNWINSL